MERTVAVENAIQCRGKRELAERLAEHKELRIESQPDENSFLTEPFVELEVTEEILAWMWESHCVPGNRVVSHHMEHSYKTPLRARLEITEDGIWIRAKFEGHWHCSECGELIDAKLWRALFDFYPDEHPILNELVLENFEIWVPWEELGEPGLVSLEGLFRKFSGGKDSLEKLARSDVNPFNHNPFDPVYVAKDSQPVILERWRNQLQNLRESLRPN